MPPLAKKVALVTGGSRGIGRSIAQRLAADGALLIVHYGNSVEGARRTLADIEAAGGRGFIVQADLDHPAESITPMFERIDRELVHRTGATGIDIVVNNAGHLVPGPIEAMGSAQFDQAIVMGAKSPFFVTQAALKRLRDGGRVINISSNTTRAVHPEVIAYAMAKGALDVFSKTLAQHLGRRRITVNSVLPGPTATEEFLKMAESNPGFVEHAKSQSALGRLGTPSDIADIVAFLASDQSGWVTGQLIDATGGTLLG
jgi:NAD(P)-dependent dehydrogenase (short-subunit alcohol dehydrogenase family)